MKSRAERQTSAPTGWSNLDRKDFTSRWADLGSSTLSQGARNNANECRCYVVATVDPTNPEAASPVVCGRTQIRMIGALNCLAHHVATGRQARGDAITCSSR